MSEAAIRSWLVTRSGPPAEPADELIQAMVRFEDRYGGLTYSVAGRNDMEYGLDGDTSREDTPLGAAFSGILDGDWTWGMDGRTAMGPGRWPYRVIDRSVTQRLERHALLTEVRGWSHRTFESLVPTHTWPIADEQALPPPVPEATGPAELWWSGPDVAVQARLTGWPPGRDRWIVCYYARKPQWATEANATVYTAVGHETVPATWCALCSRLIAPGMTCVL